MGGSDFIIVNCHGGIGCLQFHNENNEVIGGIAINEDIGKKYLKTDQNPAIYRLQETNGLPRSLYFIGDDSVSQNQFAELRCAILLSCLSAQPIEGTTHSLMDEFFDRGAHFVLGTTISIK